MKKLFFVPAAAVFCAFVFSGCAGETAVYSYWKQNPGTGFYVRHRTRTPLSAEEMRELGLVGREALPEDAKTID